MCRLVFVPPIPLSAFPFRSFVLVVFRIDLEELKRIVEMYRKEGYHIECYIRHASTVQVLNDVLGLNLKPSSALYQYQDGDQLIVVGLKKPVRGQEVQVSVEDLDIAHVIVGHAR